MRKFKDFVMVLATLGLLGIAGWFFLNPRLFLGKGAPTIGPTQAQRVLQETLTQWVYQKSKLISRRSCHNIAVEVMRYDHPLLILAICEVESQGFQPTALSNKGAIGLGQIMATEKTNLRTLVKASVITEPRDLFDIDVNIRAIDHLLTNEFLRRANGDVTVALRLYLGEHDGDYVKRILSNLANLYVLTKEKR